MYRPDYNRPDQSVQTQIELDQDGQCYVQSKDQM